MNELENQLRLLGEAAEAAVAPVAASDIVDGVDSITATDIGVHDGQGPRTNRHANRRRPSLAIAAALVCAIAAIGGIVALSSSSTKPAVDLASQTHTDSTVAAPPDDNGWAKLRFCESTEIYDIDTGNTFYGAYQFTRPTFDLAAESLGFDDYVGTNPAHAPPHIQDAAANALFLERGADVWPICGRHIRGPMITPVVPHWLAESDLINQVMVFLDPDNSVERVAEIEEEIDTILAADPAASYAFFDQDDAYAEFQSMFEGDEIARGSVDSSDMPPRFALNISRPLDEGRLRAIDGVFEVIYPVEQSTGHRRGPLRISIPSIDLNAPVRLSPTVDHLDRGPVAMVLQPDVLALAGFGSFAGSSFERLDELRDGDIVAISTAVINNWGSYEIVRTFRISAASDEPDVQDVDDLLLWRSQQGQALILVADVAGEPDQRMIVRADPVQDLSGYATSDE